MKFINTMILIVALFLLFYFSPQIIEASEDSAQNNEDSDVEINTEVNEVKNDASEGDTTESTNNKTNEEKSSDEQDSNNKSEKSTKDSEKVNETGTNEKGKKKSKSNDSKNEAKDEVDYDEKGIETEEVDKTEDTSEDSDSIDSEENAKNLDEQADTNKTDSDENSENQAEETASIMSVHSDGPPFRYKDRHPAIEDLKIKLNGVGFNGIIVTEYYGKWTKRRVKQFQKNYGLQVDGIAGNETLKKLDEVYGSNFQKGKRSKNIAAFKEKLNKMGFGGILVTNYYGDFTEKRVKQFQQFVGLKANGIADLYTRSKLNQLFRNGYKKGDRQQSIPDMKKKLNSIGFGGIRVTNYFGNLTKKRVRQFQSNYDLSVNGKANGATLTKLNEVYNSSFQKGKRHDDIIPFKEKLNLMGFDGILVTNYYGDFTEKRVKQFQQFVGLKDNGVADAYTRSKLNQLTKSGYKKGDRQQSILDLKKKLNSIGFGGITVTSYYGNWTKKRVTDFQKYYSLKQTGQVNGKTMEKLNSIVNHPFQEGKRHNEISKLKKDLNTLGYDGIIITNYFGSWTESRLKQFQKDYDLIVSGIAEENTIKKLEELVADPNYTKHDITLDEATDKQMNVSPQTDKNQAWISKNYVKNGKVTASVLNVRKKPGTPSKILGKLRESDKVTILGEWKGWYSIEYNHSEQWVHANPNDIKFYLDPSNFIDDTEQKFQFLDLSRESGASKKFLNGYLSDKGILEGQGQAFIDASKQHGVNDVYLISHATHETGNGSSKLATGVEVGKDQSGDLSLVTDNNRNKLKSIKEVYNMFGVHAFDNCALECGAKKAYKEGWTTPAKAIKGGAAFIGNSYVKAGQNTLYQMRWNPAAMVNGAPSHQYATDIGWASKQIKTMHNLYQSMKIKNVYLDIPEYK